MGELSLKSHEEFKNIIMIIGPKYKIARRLGAPIFEKTQTQKYALNLEKKGKKRGMGKPKTEFGTQLNEKQKAKFTYSLSEKQFSNYVKEALVRKNSRPAETIFEFLETRLDNVMYRLGFSPTRLGARQMTSHGHITVNGRRVTIPSLRVKIGDKIGVKASSLTKPLFTDLASRVKNKTIPSWLNLDVNTMVAEVTGKPHWSPAENMFDLNTVIEFYSR
jgi:small subunit ribosomal protein S4